MFYLKSHNDYKNEKFFSEAYIIGARIIEFDFLSFFKKLVIAHDVFDFFFNSEQRSRIDLYAYLLMNNFYNDNDEKIVFQIELKSSNKEFCDNVIKEISDVYANDYRNFRKRNFKIYISAIDRWYLFGRRIKAKKYILDKLPFCGDYEVFEKENEIKNIN